MVRCFIGIMIPEYIKSNFINVQNQLKNLPLEAKFVEPENLHLSISFLGEISEEKIKRMCDVLDFIGKKHHSFEIYVSGIKIIPNENYIRVLAVNIEKNSDLDRIVEEVKKMIGGDTKPPHITLCRVKKIDKKVSIPEIKKIIINIKFTVNSICLVKSTLSKTGPVYDIIHEIKLR